MKKLFLTDKVLFTAILINGIIIALTLFPRFANNHILEYIDYGFIIFFLIEMIVKIHHYSWKGYWSSWGNRFDASLVLMSFPSILALFFPVPNLSILLLFRLFRLARLFRLLRFIPHMDKLARGIFRALKASVLVMLSLLIFNIFLAIFSCYMFQNTAPEYFGDPLISAYSIFQIFTLEGWYEIADAVIEHSGPVAAFMTRIYFILMVISGGIFGLSIANAVFVDEMTMDNNDDLEKKVDDLNAKLERIEKLLSEASASGQK